MVPINSKYGAITTRLDLSFIDKLRVMTKCQNGPQMVPVPPRGLVLPNLLEKFYHNKISTSRLVPKVLFLHDVPVIAIAVAVAVAIAVAVAVAIATAVTIAIATAVAIATAIAIAICFISI